MLTGWTLITLSLAERPLIDIDIYDMIHTYHAERSIKLESPKTYALRLV